MAAYAPAAHALGGLVRFGNERERTKACRSLGRLGDPIVVPLLTRAMGDDSWVVRAQAATALGAAGGPEVLGELRSADATPDCRRLAIDPSWPSGCANWRVY